MAEADYLLTDLLKVNFSTINFPFPLWLVRPDWECALKIGFYIPIWLISFLGNSFVFYLMCTNRFLRTSINIFIWNLASADLASILLFPWINLCSDLYQMYILGAVICQSDGFLRVTLMLVDVFSLVAISYERFMSVAFPMRFKMDYRIAYCVCASIWVIAGGIAAPLLTSRIYKERQWKDVLEAWCSDNIAFNSFVYYTSLDAVAVWFPLIVMSVVFSWISIKLKQRTLTCPSAQLKHLAQRKKVNRMLLFILLAFIICYTPFTMVIIVRNKVVVSTSINSVPEWLRDLQYVSRYLTCVNTCINPIIYGFCNDNFRKAAVKQFPRLQWGTQSAVSTIAASSVVIGKDPETLTASKAAEASSNNHI